MRKLAVLLISVVLSACADMPLPSLAPSPDPYDPTAPSADIPYRPVMAGTVSHGVGGRR